MASRAKVMIRFQSVLKVLGMTKPSCAKTNACNISENSRIAIPCQAHEKLHRLNSICAPITQAAIYQGVESLKALCSHLS